jgi:hypothetical protein
MSTVYGEYLVTGRREYRGHKPGCTFTARLDRRAEQRAMGRGDIRLIQRVEPRPGPHTFPTGWPRGSREEPLSLGEE